MTAEATVSSGLGLVGRLLAALLRRAPAKRLEASILGRGIVAEVPFDAPCVLLDREANELRNGVYVLVVRLWNRGAQPVHAADFASSAPLRIQLDSSVRTLAASAVSAVEGFEVDARLDVNGSVLVDHEGFGPGDDAVISVYYTGADLQAPVNVQGRIVGQTTPLDCTHNEGRASSGERLAAAAVLTLLLNALPGFFIGGFLIWRDYGLLALWSSPERLPWYLIAPFSLGTFVLSLAVFVQLQRWFERRQHPKGYPLDVDIEPPFIENVKGLVMMALTGRRFRISNSFFSAGQPLLATRKPIKQRSVRDWMA
jgi:hypothetical protein